MLHEPLDIESKEQKELPTMMCWSKQGGQELGMY
jgi:hypothetical protein